jgi:hypothetical protein
MRRSNGIAEYASVTNALEPRAVHDARTVWWRGGDGGVTDNKKPGAGPGSSCVESDESADHMDPTPGLRVLT